MVQTGEALGSIERASMTDAGELIVAGEGKTAQLDDRDMAQMLESMRIGGEPATDEALMGWLEGGSAELTLAYRAQVVPVQRIGREDLETAFGFVRVPQP